MWPKAFWGSCSDAEESLCSHAKWGARLWEGCWKKDQHTYNCQVQISIIFNGSRLVDYDLNTGNLIFFHLSDNWRQSSEFQSHWQKWGYNHLLLQRMLKKPWGSSRCQLWMLPCQAASQVNHNFNRSAGTSAHEVERSGCKSWFSHSHTKILSLIEPRIQPKYCL